MRRIAIIDDDILDTDIIKSHIGDDHYISVFDDYSEFNDKCYCVVLCDVFTAGNWEIPVDFIKKIHGRAIVISNSARMILEAERLGLESCAKTDLPQKIKEILDDL